MRVAIIVIAVLIAVVCISALTGSNDGQRTKASDIVQVAVYRKGAMSTQEAAAMDLSNVPHCEFDERLVAEGVKVARFESGTCWTFWKSGGTVGVAKLANGEEKRVIVTSDGCLIIAGQPGRWQMPVASREWLHELFRKRLYAPAAPATSPTSRPSGLVPLDVTVPKIGYDGEWLQFDRWRRERPDAEDCTLKLAPFLVPTGTRNLAVRRPATSSDPEPAIGDLKQLTDGNKEGTEDATVELMHGLQGSGQYYPVARPKTERRAV